MENKVGYERRNDFVPVPFVNDLQAFNRQLLADAHQDFSRLHYKKEKLISDLLEEDHRVLLALPRQPFEACRYARVITDGYGKFCLDDCHFYSSAPEYALQEIVVRVSAFTVAPLTREAIPITEHPREFGKSRTDITDYQTTIAKLIKTPGAWRNSGLRTQLDGAACSSPRWTGRILPACVKHFEPCRPYGTNMVMTLPSQHWKKQLRWDAWIAPARRCWR